MILTGETEVLGEKPVKVSHCSPQTSHGLTWDRSRVSAVIWTVCNKAGDTRNTEVLCFMKSSKCYKI